MSEKNSRSLITIFLCGDVMTGRGIDQILPHPGDPHIHEPYVRDARKYVDLAEEHNGYIPIPAGFSHIWGDTLDELRRMAPDARIINLETSITRSDDYWQGKGINYRMNPENIPVITSAGIDICSLANNHVLDWGYAGLAETIRTLHEAKISTAGAGRNLQDAAAPAVLEVAKKGRVIVYSLGMESSGIPSNWAAASDRPGVHLLQDLSQSSVLHLESKVREVRRQGDIVIASIHWGGNWGYKIPDEQIEFSHRLIDTAGIDVIHGHSSHHVKGIEIYADKPVFYGCGDFLNDYEGIGGYESFRGDLSLMYFVVMDPASGKLVELRMIPMQMKKFRVNRASSADAAWLRDTLNREGKRFGVQMELCRDKVLNAHWQ